MALGRLIGRSRDDGGDADPQLEASRESYERDGYLALKGFVDPVLCDRVIAEAEAFYARRDVPVEKADRTMNFHQESEATREILEGEKLSRVLSALMGAEAVFLQSIYFTAGSQQPAHSDYMFMSTEPDFHLCGFWLACEDVGEDAGPLVYYPGSHQLFRQNIADYYAAHIDETRAEIEAHRDELEDRYAGRMGQTGESLLSCVFYDRWTDELHSSLREGGYEEKRFLPRKGDAIVWHAGLVHGGSPVTTEGRTRRSLVAHYLTRSVRKYFDMNYVDSQHHLTLKTIKKDRPAELQVKS